MALHPTALVVRGGQTRDVEDLRQKVDIAIEDGEGACLCVFADVDKSDEGPGMTLRDLCHESGIPHGQVQLSTAAVLAEAGFNLELDTSGEQARTHHYVTLREPVEQSQLLQFIECFDEPVPNPVPKVQRSGR